MAPDAALPAARQARFDPSALWIAPPVLVLSAFFFYTLGLIAAQR